MSKTKRSNYIKSFFIIVFFFIVSILFLQSFIPTKEVTQKHSDSTNFPQGYRIVIPEVPEHLEIFGEKVPLNNFEVYERVEREFIVNTYWHSLTILTLKRANRWFPVIEPILKKNNIPDDFKYLCVTESTLLNLTSPKNAVGFWQFKKDTGKRYGLEINKEIDERYSVEKSTEAACKYFWEAYNKFNNWTLVAASYNMGITGIAEQLSRQKTHNYYNIVLGEETSRYVPRIIAAKIMMQNPKKYGFDIRQEELHKPFETTDIVVDYKVKDWADFAKSYGLNYKILKLYNPWLRESYLTNKKKKTYHIKIPVKGSIEVIQED
jgi:hypothetical protein